MHVLSAIANVFDNSPPSSPLLISIYQAIKDPFNAEISSIIEAIIVPELLHNASNTVMRIQESFAVQMGVDGLLDVARKTLTDVQNEMSELLENYRKSVSDLKLVHNPRRGWYLTAPANVQLTPMFIEKSVKVRHCYGSCRHH